MYSGIDWPLWNLPYATTSGPLGSNRLLFDGLVRISTGCGESMRAHHTMQVSGSPFSEVNSLLVWLIGAELYLRYPRSFVGRSVNGRPILSTPLVPSVLTYVPTKMFPAASLPITPIPMKRVSSLAASPVPLEVSSVGTVLLSPSVVAPLLPVPQ